MPALPAVAFKFNTASVQLLLRAAREPTHESIRLAFLLPFTRQDINHALWLLTTETPAPSPMQVAQLIVWNANIHYRPGDGQPLTIENLNELGMEPLLQALGIL